jgi:hypothetical protein
MQTVGVTAPGAGAILDMRKKGLRPGSDVVVSLVGDLPVDFLVQPDIDTVSSYDWCWAIDLNVWIVASSGANASQVKQLLWQFKAHRPSHLFLWLDDQDRGYEVYFFPKIESIKFPIDSWKWEIDFLPLMKFQNQEMAQTFKRRPR